MFINNKNTNGIWIKNYLVLLNKWNEIKRKFWLFIKPSNLISEQILKMYNITKNDNINIKYSDWFEVINNKKAKILWEFNLLVNLLNYLKWNIAITDNEKYTKNDFTKNINIDFNFKPNKNSQLYNYYLKNIIEFAKIKLNIIWNNIK